MDNRAQVASQFIEAALIDCDRRPSQLGNDKNSIDPIIRLSGVKTSEKRRFKKTLFLFILF